MPSPREDIFIIEKHRHPGTLVPVRLCGLWVFRYALCAMWLRSGHSALVEAEVALKLSPHIHQ